MKRKIVFRGKCKDTDKWVFGNLIRDIDGTTVHIYQKMGKKSNFYEVDENTVGQFTGLFDANKKGIYEGDVVRFLYDEKSAIVAWNRRGMWCLLFDDDPHGLLSVKPLDSWMYGDGFEVVGNVFDNSIK